VVGSPALIAVGRLTARQGRLTTQFVIFVSSLVEKIDVKNGNSGGLLAK
jgi:hypothetical protein